MAQSQIKIPSVEELQALNAVPTGNFDPTKFGQGVSNGLDLAQALTVRKQAQEDRERALAKEIKQAMAESTFKKVSKAGTPSMSDITNYLPKESAEEQLKSQLEAQKDKALLERASVLAGTKGVVTKDIIGPDGKTHTVKFHPDGTQEDLGLAGQASQNFETTQTRSTAEFANKLLPHIGELRSLIQQADEKGYIGPTAGRIYQGFLAGKVGSTGDPAADQLLGELKSKASLVASGALRTHFGARGGQQMYDRFVNNLDTTTQSRPLLEGELNGFEDFIRGYGNQPTRAAAAAEQTPSSGTTSPGSSSPQPAAGATGGGIDTIAAALGLKKRSQ